MKKIFVVFLILLSLPTFCSCSNNAPNRSSNQQNSLTEGIPLKEQQLISLFIRGNKDEYLKLLDEFPKNHKFYAFDMWSMVAIMEKIDANTSQLMENKKYSKILSLFDSNYPNTSESISGGPYGVFDKWFNVFDSNELGGTYVKYSFIQVKNGKIIKFLIDNAKDYINNDPIIVARLLHFREAYEDYPLFVKIEENNIPASDLNKINEILRKFENESLILSNVLFITPPPGTLDLNYRDMKEKLKMYSGYLTAEYISDKMEKGYDFHQIPGTNFFGVKLLEPRSDSKTGNLFLIFQKSNEKMTPVILYEYYPEGAT